MGKQKSLIFLFGLEILAIAYYIWHQVVSASFGWNESWRYLQILLIFALVALLAVGLSKLLRFCVDKIARRFKTQSSEIFPPLVLSLSPFLLLFLIILPHFVFLKDIRGCLLPVALFGSAYLLSVFNFRLKRTYSHNFTDSESIGLLNPNQISLARLLLLFFALSLLVNVILASGVILPHRPLTGDEPHYLIITQSILEDGDINLHNNYQDQDYLEFYPGELEAHAYRGKKGGRFLYSKHFPALSVLLAPAYFLGEKVSLQITDGPNKVELKRRIIIFFSRLPLCLFTALFGILFFLLVYDITQRRNVSAFAWLFFCFTTPILFYSHLLYPEIPAALLTIFVIRNLILRQPANQWILFLSGVGIALLPWFGIKFFVLAAVLFFVSAIAQADKKTIRQIWAKAPFFLFPIFISAASYMMFFWVLYGNFSPISAYKGVSSGHAANPYSFKPPVLFISETLRRLLGYFIDQKFGLFVYSPIFLLGIAGFYFLFKRKRRVALLLMTVVIVYALFSAGFYWGGFCPPPRPIIPVLSIWGLFMAAALGERQSVFRMITTTFFAFLSFLVVWAALRDPWLPYPEQHANLLGGELLYAKLFRNLGNAFIPVQAWLPSLTWEGMLSWIPIVFWVTAITLMTVLFIRKTQDRKSKSASLNMIGQMCLVFVLSILLLLYTFFDIQLDKKAVFAGEDYVLYFQDDNHFGAELGGFWSLGSRPATVILKSIRPLSAIQVLLTSPVKGETMVQVGTRRKIVTRKDPTDFNREADFTLPKGLPLQKGYFYTITIKDSTGFVPNRLDCEVTDNRRLGVFVRIKTR